MDFSKIKTTDDLVPHFPPPDEENNLWEFKDAKVLNKSEIAAKLGKAVSAFANTGGGYLVFGVHATTGDLQSCPQMFGNVTTNPRTRSLLIYGGCERTKGSQTLLPTEKATVAFAIQNHFVTAMNNDGQDNRKHEEFILSQFSELALKFRAVSQNFVGQEYPWRKSEDPDRNEALKNHFILQMRQAGHAIGEP